MGTTAVIKIPMQLAVGMCVCLDYSQFFVTFIAFILRSLREIEAIELKENCCRFVDKEFNMAQE